MKKYIILIVFISFNVFAQSPIEDFNTVMDAYNSEYTSATTDAQREIVNTKYDNIIATAENTLETALESQIQAEAAALKAEQDASAQELVDLEKEFDEVEEETEETTEVVEESQDLKKFKYFLSIGKDYFYIYKKFSKNDLKAIATEVGASTSGYKKDIALSIQNKIK